MADIFHEVDEEVRRDQLKKLWDNYSIYLIALAVLIVAAIGAWRGYEYWVAKKAAAAGAAFESAVTLSEQGKHSEAETAFTKVVTEAPEGYRVLARFRAAAELGNVKPADAVKAYDDLAADSSLGATWQDLAGLRAGLLLVDSAQLADMRRAVMARSFGWSAAAAEYETLYRRLIGPRTVAARPKPRAVKRSVAPPVTEALVSAA